MKTQEIAKLSKNRIIIVRHTYPYCHSKNFSPWIPQYFLSYLCSVFQKHHFSLYLYFISFILSVPLSFSSYPHQPLSPAFLYFLYLLLYLSLISLSHNLHKEVGTNIPYPMYTYPSYTTLSHNSTILLFLPSTSVINYKWHILTRQGNDEDMENSFL